MKALIFYGGWEGHDPEGVARLLAEMLENDGFEVTLAAGQECLDDGAALKSFDLLVPCYTMSSITRERSRNVSAAVESGVGLAGIHGGMCDAFRDDTDWQFMTGGQFVAHPGGNVDFTVNIGHPTAPGLSKITEGIDDFSLHGEQYYLHVDPAIEILATTHFPTASGPHTSNKPIDMPVAWVKHWGSGRVFYCSIGHNSTELRGCEPAMRLIERGFLYAAGRK